MPKPRSVPYDETLDALLAEAQEFGSVHVLPDVTKPKHFHVLIVLADGYPVVSSDWSKPIHEAFRQVIGRAQRMAPQRKEAVNG